MRDALDHLEYPGTLVEAHHTEPCPRRVRATLNGETVLDTTRARYVWEWPFYPQYYVPLADVRSESLFPEGVEQHTPFGNVELFGVRVGDVHRSHAAKVLGDAKLEQLKNTVRFEWSAFDAWYEEDEKVFVHPRNPYVRVDSLRSTRHVRVELDGVALAESSSPVLVFETGLPTRYYLNRTEVDFSRLVGSETVTQCPYKGTTTGYWSARIGDSVHADVAWTYEFPSLALAPIAGLVAFYNEKVDLVVDGTRLERPDTHFVRSKRSETAS